MKPWMKPWTIGVVKMNRLKQWGRRMVEYLDSDAHTRLVMWVMFFLSLVLYVLDKESSRAAYLIGLAVFIRLSLIKFKITIESPAGSKTRITVEDHNG